MWLIAEDGTLCNIAQANKIYVRTPYLGCDGFSLRASLPSGSDDGAMAECRLTNVRKDGGTIAQKALAMLIGAMHNRVADDGSAATILCDFRNIGEEGLTASP